MLDGEGRAQKRAAGISLAPRSGNRIYVDLRSALILVADVPTPHEQKHICHLVCAAVSRSHGEPRLNKFKHNC